MSDTQKMQNFLAESMVGKPVSDVPGIGRESVKKLEDAGVTKVNMIR